MYNKGEEVQTFHLEGTAMSDKMNIGTNFYTSYIPRQLDGAVTRPLLGTDNEPLAAAGDSITISTPAEKEKSVKPEVKAHENKTVRQDPGEVFSAVKQPELFVPQGTLANNSVSSVPTSFFMEDPSLAALGDVELPSDIRMRDSAGPGSAFFGTGLNSLNSMMADGAIYNIDGEKLN